MKTNEQLIESLNDLMKQVMQLGEGQMFPNERLITIEISNAIGMIKTEQQTRIAEDLYDFAGTRIFAENVQAFWKSREYRLTDAEKESVVREAIKLEYDNFQTRSFSHE